MQRIRFYHLCNVTQKTREIYANFLFGKVLISATFLQLRSFDQLQDHIAQIIDHLPAHFSISKHPVTVMAAAEQQLPLHITDLFFISSIDWSLSLSEQHSTPTTNVENHTQSLAQRLSAVNKETTSGQILSHQQSRASIGIDRNSSSNVNEPGNTDREGLRKSFSSHLASEAFDSDSDVDESSGNPDGNDTIDSSFVSLRDDNSVRLPTFLVQSHHSHRPSFQWALHSRLDRSSTTPSNCIHWHKHTNQSSISGIQSNCNPKTLMNRLSSLCPCLYFLTTSS